MIRKTYPAGGWLPEGAYFQWQRSDQGRDFVTNWRGIIQAPGNWTCVNVSSDAPFPNGFGPSYPWIRIESGKFAGHTYYIGHCTSLVSTGDKGGFGHPLARSDQGQPGSIGVSTHAPGGGGWVEFGEVLNNGSLGPMSDTGHWFDGLLAQPLVLTYPDPPIRYGDWGVRVFQLTHRLAICGWLKHSKLKFDSEVHGAVVGFKLYNHLPIPPISKDPKKQQDRGVVDDRTGASIAHSADWCKKHKTKQYRQR